MTVQTQNEGFEKKSLEPLINSFLDETKNENTRRARKNDLTILYQWLERILVEQGVQDRNPRTTDWTAINTSAFLKERSKLDGPNSYARRVANYRKFARFVETLSPNFENPMTVAGTPSRIERMPRVLHQAEIDLLRQYAAAQVFRTSRYPSRSRRYFQRFRTWMVFELMLHTGIRPSELINLTHAQVDSLMAKLRDVPSPGYLLNDVPIANDILGLFRAYLNVRESILIDNCNCDPSDQQYWASIPLFPSLYGSRPSEPSSLRMTPKTQWRFLVGLGEAAGIQKVSARILRDTFAVQKLTNTYSIRKTADALRFTDWRMSDLRVRRRYLMHAQRLLETRS
jgi:site-specific recombinase XerD